MAECLLSCFSHVWLFATPWTTAHQAPLSMGFSSKITGVGCHAPPPGALPNPGIEPMSPVLLHCRQILYHWATREAQQMIRQVNRQTDRQSGLLPERWLLFLLCGMTIDIHKERCQQLFRWEVTSPQYQINHRCESCYPNCKLIWKRKQTNNSL